MALGVMGNQLPLLIGGVGLVKGSVRGLGPALSELSHEIGSEIWSRKLLSSAPFTCISVIVRYGEKTTASPGIGRINQHDELEVAMTIAIDELRSVRGVVSDLKSKIEPHIRGALNAVFDKYGLHVNDT